MKLLRFAAFAAALSFAAPAIAQNEFKTPTAGKTVVGVQVMCQNGSGQSVPCSALTPLPITGSISASLGGFAPNGNYGTLTATASSSASTSLPTGTDVGIQNTSTVDVSCVLDPTAATATTNKIIVRGGATVFVTVGSNTKIACINQTGSASNVIALMGGTGLGTNFGGGGGGSGGAVTIASGGVASGAFSSGSIASGAFASGSVATGAFAAGSLASGAGVDGWDLTQGAKADSVCGSDTATCSGIAIAKRIAQNLSTLNSTASTGTANTGSAVPASAIYMGMNVGGNLTGLTGTANGLKVDGSAVTQPVSISGNQAANITQFGGNNVATGTGAGGNGIPRVTPSNDTAAGLAPVKSSVPIVNGGNDYEHVAASTTAEPLGATGAIGDYLSHCVIYPGTTGAGAVTVFDGTNSAANIVIEFATGTLSNLAPIPVPVGAISKQTGGWKATTGSNVTLVCEGKFT